MVYSTSYAFGFFWCFCFYMIYNPTGVSVSPNDVIYMSGVFAPLHCRLVNLEAQSSSDTGRQDHTQDYAADDDHDLLLQKHKHTNTLVSVSHFSDIWNTVSNSYSTA